ncbi:hypothetical protein A5885_000894, partial [Enterococcus sp. 8E11_MSG4843]
NHGKEFSCYGTCLLYTSRCV